MVDFKKILNGLSSSDVSKGFLGGLAGGAVSGALTSKKGRKGAKKLIKYGGLAAVGALAWNAYKQYNQNQSNPQSGIPTDSVNNNQNGNQQSNQLAYWTGLNEQQFENLDETKPQEQSIYILKTMVAAAMSDGHLDPSEYQNIANKADSMGLSNEDRALVFNEISAPMSLNQVIAESNTPELAMEVYTASVLAIDEDQAQGREYLQKLAAGLQLPPPLVQAVHNQISNS
ncbi:tellurite resistance TerB family protein [Aliikangiella marina]|uniref:Tellurite resistance TerB family protein n=1 Tax=Aliikangiella marina TaxID=1712262 RepID=A0A545THS5_9GAMM|nr:tellurite resistance TerB family protein [Aliikangiella marina]TQV76758.1 tellurite resistance TerB family protein [Aliikangiella marina]